MHKNVAGTSEFRNTFPPIKICNVIERLLRTCIKITLDFVYRHFSGNVPSVLYNLLKHNVSYIQHSV